MCRLWSVWLVHVQSIQVEVCYGRSGVCAYNNCSSRSAACINIFSLMVYHLDIHWLILAGIFELFSFIQLEKLPQFRKWSQDWPLNVTHRAFMISFQHPIVTMALSCIISKEQLNTGWKLQVFIIQLNFMSQMRLNVWNYDWFWTSRTKQLTGVGLTDTLM